MTLPASRLLYLLAFIICVVLLLVALYMEHYMGLLPCPLCIIQRIAFVLIGLTCLAAVIHNPAPRPGRARAGAARGYAIATTVFAAFGAAIAGRQVWLQYQPADQLPSCLPPLEYMIDVMPMGQLITELFSGTADCAAVSWTFLGLSIAECTLIAFIGFTIFGLVQIFRSND